MIRRFFLIAVIVCLAAPLLAQAPAGLRMRVDRSQNAEDPDDRPDLHVVAKGKGFQVTGGPAGTFWNPKQAAEGDYTAKAVFTLLKPSGHTNYYGLVFGGSSLEGANQAYTYFLVAQDGTYVVRNRVGEKVTDVQRMAHAVIRQPDASGRSTNAVEVRVAGDTVSYVVNGTVVHTSARSAVRTNGVVGVRVNHLLDVMVEGVEVDRK